MAPPSRHPLFAVCAPGLESLLVSEIAALGVRGPRARNGGVGFEATTRQLYAANLLLRTATRVVLRVGRFRARSFEELEDGVRALELRRVLAPDGLVHVRATATGSRLYHTGAIAERVERFLREGAIGNRPAATAPVATDPAAPQLVIVRVVHDEVTVSIDTSGEPLYKRGWRHEVAKAPLRETLAAAMLIGSGWTPGTPLIDPLCGSGTIPIEGALLAKDVAPGHGRSFAFQDWPSFEPGTWASVAGAAKAALAARADEPVGAGPAIVARDRDAGAVAATERNADRAGVRADIDVATGVISDLMPSPGSAPGWILTNPPYGARVQGGHDLRDLYARFGDVVRTSFEGWSVGMLVAEPALAAHTRLRLEERWRATNGGIPVHFLTAPA
jgi:putative N6-adenine-specific DNA methylase